MLMEKKSPPRVGELLLSEGLVSPKELSDALSRQYESYRSVGRVLMEMGVLNEDDLYRVLAKQVENEQREKVGEILVAHGYITHEQLDTALEHQDKSDIRLGKLLEDMGFLDEDKVMDALSVQLDIPHVRLEDHKITKENAEWVPASLALGYRIVALGKVDNKLQLAMADPTDFRCMDHIRSKTGMEIEPFLAKESSILAAIDTMTKSRSGEGGDAEDKDASQDPPSLTEKELEAVVASILNQAIEAEATAVTLAATEQSLNVRYQTGMGEVEKPSLPGVLQSPVLDCLLRMAKEAKGSETKDGLAQTLIPWQSGGTGLQIGVEPDDPKDASEIKEVKVRFVKPGTQALSVKEAGFADKQLEELSVLAGLEGGVVAAAGEQGGGRSTTLYTLAGILKGDRAATALVEKLETAAKGVCQIPVGSESVSWESTLGQLTRSPDMILASDVPAQSEGFLLAAAKLSPAPAWTMACIPERDCVSTLLKLKDYDSGEYLSTVQLRAIVAGSVLQSICPGCKEPYTPSGNLLEYAGLPEKTVLYRGKGCDQCEQTGLSGNIGLYELLIFSGDNAQFLTSGLTADEMRAKLAASGFVTFAQAGLKLAIQGRITLDQVLGMIQ